MNRVELLHPDKKFTPRNVKNLEAWSAKIAKELPVGTTMIIRRGSGTIQWTLTAKRAWKYLRETYGP